MTSVETHRSGFRKYQQLRQSLAGACDEIDRIWSQLVSSRLGVGDIDTAVPPVDADPVRSQLAEVRTRLERSTIDVTILGHVNRGKSTLLNALVGEQVSSMRVTPETAVPVWVEAGERNCAVEYSDGAIKPVDLELGLAAGTQRDRKKRREKREGGDAREIVKVIQTVESPLLNEGIRLIDTPGLDDPSSEAFEASVFAEIDRSAAGLFLIVSPPGIAGIEVNLVEALGTRGVDKLFFACNFYSDNWEDPETRREVLENVTAAVERGAATSGGTIRAEDLRVYAVNAKHAWRAQQQFAEGEITAEQRDRAVVESGLAHLRADLEVFLSEGALQRLTDVCGGYLNAARDVVATQLRRRLEIIGDPSKLQKMRSTRNAEIRRAEDAIDAINDRIAGQADRTMTRARALLQETFGALIAEVGQLQRTSQIPTFEDSARYDLNTMTNRLNALLAETSTDMQALVSERLQRAFGYSDVDVAGKLRATKVDGLNTLNLRTRGRGSSDGTMVAAAAGAGLVGSIAGGAGVALIAAGPVGWILGAALGAYLGYKASEGYENQLRGHERDAIRAKLEEQRRVGDAQVAKIVSAMTASIEKEVRRRGDAFTADTRSELAALQRLAENESARSEQLGLADTLLQRLDAAL